MEKLTNLEKEIVIFVHKEKPVREQIISQSFYFSTLKEVRKAFTKLRKAGIIYKVNDGWYQTDFLN